MASLLPNIPDNAEIIIAEYWSGWFWAFVNEWGQERWCLLYREQGASGGSFMTFKDLFELEMFMDGLDLPF